MAAVARSRPRWGRPKPDFVARTIAGVTGAIERTVFTEEQARADGMLQRADPRAKLVLFAVAVLVAGLSRSLPVLLALYAATVLLALWSGLSLGFFVKRVLLGIPLFASIVFVPALFLIAGRPVLQLPLGPIALTVSDNALWSGAAFITRVAASVSLAALLVVTTRWADLLKAMRVLRLPAIFIVILGMTYRYVFLFLQLVEQLFLARASRTVGAAAAREQRQWLGGGMGTLLGKSFKTSNDVYMAMVARGFTGDIRTMSEFRMRDEDWLLLAAGLVALALALLVDLGLR
ncbi:MAG TPA: cobalt ECF transporter T component CbiQ [Thermomicrobiales bacterium]|nr:cobalt ECF transporter T component CbiQ [Thermomicrobiales bacterium]